MEIITYFFTSKNIRNVFITFMLIFNIHFSFSQVDLRTCNFDCTSNNYTLKDVYLSLSNVNGDPITNTTCTIGEVRQVYIYLNYSSNSNSNIYFARLNSDLTIAGVTTFVNVLLGTIVPGDNKKLLYGPFNWTCGDELSLSNTIIAWKTNSNNNPGTNYNCGSYTNSQCDFTNSFVISKPLAVQFTYKACKTGTNTTAKFTSTTNGGIAPYSYAWDFNNDGGAPDSTIANPTYTYTTSNNSAKLTVTDSQNLTNTYILPIIEPAEIMLSETHTNIGCSGGTTSLILNVTGGTPGYTYSWNTGATTKDLLNITPGTYTVTVTDVNSCIKTQSFIINQPTTLAATTSQTNVTCFGGSDGTATVIPTGGIAPYTYAWSPSGGSNATATGLLAGTYSILVTDTNNCTTTKNITIIDGDSVVPVINPLPAPTTINCPALPVFAEATATDNSGVVSSLTYIESITDNNCTGSYTKTRIWTAKDACGNTSAPVSQVITVQDITKSTWNPNQNLNVTVECDNILGLASAQALFPVASDLCDTDVSNIVKVSGQFLANIGCTNAGSYTNTWTVTDDCGNISDTFTQTITIQDTTAPTWTTAAADINTTLQCSDLTGLAAAQNMAPVASDNCEETVTYTKTSGVFIAGSCVNSGTYTNTWVAKDVCNNTSSTFTQIIKIEDTTAPTWTTAAADLNTILQCSDVTGLAAAQNMAPVASDNCAGTVTYTKTSGIFTPASCLNSGTYTNTWVAKDVCNNTSTTFTQIIIIEDTTAPTWTTAAADLNTTLQCSDVTGLAAAQNMAPVASDNCGETVTYTKTSGVFTAGSCVNSGIYTNTWVATDVCNNTSATFTQVITIEDTTAPTWATEMASLNMTLQCSDTAGLALAQAMFPTAFDLCDADVSNIIKVSGQFMASEGCSNAGTYTNTWTVKDDCGNTSDAFTQIITIEDTTAPTWATEMASLNMTLQCSDTAGLALAQAMFPTAFDLCDADVSNIIKVSGQFMASEGCSNAGTYTNTWTVKDDCGNTSDAFTQIITIEDTTAPTWSSEMVSLNLTLQCSDTAGLTLAQAMFPTASDLCDADVSNIVKVSGQFMASEGCSNAGTYTNTWTVKDDCGNTSNAFTQIITIEDTTAPTWSSEMVSLNLTLQCSDTAGLTLAQAMFPTASDLCDADVSNIVKVSGQFMASEGCSNAGTYTNTWTVKDDCGNTSNAFTQIITIEDTTAPTWSTEMASLNLTLQCSDTAGLALAQAMFPTAFDLCDTDVSNIIKVSGQFMASEGCGNSGTYTNTWTVKDDCGNTSDTFTQVITIEDTTAPTWSSEIASLNMTLQCSNTAGLALAQAMFPTASDLCDADVSNIVKVSGQFMASEGCSNTGTYTNTWTVKDDCGNTSNAFTQIITIEDTTAPTWSTEMASLNLTLQCSDTAGLALAQAMFPTAFDLCDADVSNIIKVSGQFMASEGCGNSGTYTNTWTVKDDCGNNSDTFTQVITIEDTTAPTWSSEMASLNLTLQCSDTAGLALAQALFPTASDLCDADVSNIIKVSGQFVASEGCSNAGTYTNTWTVKDDCGNTSDTFTQVITIEDTTAPTWITEMASLNLTLQCSDTAGLALAQAIFPTASDLCDADVSNIAKVSGQFMASEGCGNSGTYTNTWTVKDDCGNTSDTFTQVITIEDTTAPTWSSEMASLNLTLQCSDTAGLTLAQALFPTASDLCDADVSNIVKVSGQFLASEGCSNAGTYTNTWTVKDDCGNNSDTFTQVITIEDTTAPTWSSEMASLNLTLQCSDTAGLALAQAMFPTASDLCDADVSNIVKISGQFMASEGCGNSGTYTNTWTVKDDCGNTSDTFTQVITIEDTTAPTWSSEMASLNLNLQCSDTAGLALAQAMFPTASDLCDADVFNIVKVSGQFVASEGCSNAGTYTNTWTVKDDCGNTSDTFTQVITIEDTTAPTWSSEIASLNMTLQCSDTAGLALALAMFPIASDLCDADVSNIVKVSGQFMASEGCSNSGTYTNTWTVKDDCGNTSDTFTQVITIEDTTAPTWSSEIASLNLTLQCSNTAGLALAQALFPTASDLCDADVSNIIKVSGQFVASEGCSNAGTYTNTWTVKDDCGNTSDIFTQVITLQDTTMPMFTGNLPTDITVSCDAVPEPVIVEASDNCNSNLPIVFSETKSNIQNECTSNYTLTRTWTTSDCSGNTVSHFQIITVRDTTAPTGTAPTSVANLQSIASIPVGSTEDIKDAADNCSESVNISISDSNNGGSGCEGNAYILTRTYTLTDCAGNKTELVQTFTIENKVFVTAVASNVTCFEGNDGSILITTGPGTMVTVTNENNEVVGNTGLRAGKYTLIATSPVNSNNQVCSVTTTITITEPSNVIINLTGEGCSSDSSPLNLSNLLPENVSLTGTWTDTNGTNALQGNILNVFGLSLGNYAFEYKTNENCPRSFLLNMAINDDCRVLACENVVIHNAFSPNGDGKNDFFKIDNIDLTTCYPENSVEIYNRWGILVFETVNYNNTTNYFDGTSRGRTTVKESDGLPTGTYFYIINYKSLDGNNVLKSNKEDGFLYLSK
jgi:gliding motility-associated-like protein